MDRNFNTESSLQDKWIRLTSREIPFQFQEKIEQCFQYILDEIQQQCQHQEKPFNASSSNNLYAWSSQILRIWQQLLSNRQDRPKRHQTQQILRQQEVQLSLRHLQMIDITEGHLKSPRHLQAGKIVKRRVPKEETIRDIEISSGNLIQRVAYETNSRYCLLWLHDLDENAESYVPLFFQNDLIDRNVIKLLGSPDRGSWFPVKGKNWKQDSMFEYSDLERASRLLEEQVREEKRVWGSLSRVFVGGVGQGATVAVYYAFSTKEKPVGVISVDGLLPDITPFTRNRYLAEWLIVISKSFFFYFPDYTKSKDNKISKEDMNSHEVVEMMFAG